MGDRERIFETASKRRGGERDRITRFYSNMFYYLLDVFFGQSTEFGPDCARERRVRYRGWWNKNRIYRLRNCANLAFLYHNRSSVLITVLLYHNRSSVPITVFLYQ